MQKVAEQTTSSVTKISLVSMAILSCAMIILFSSCIALGFLLFFGWQTPIGIN